MRGNVRLFLSVSAVVELVAGIALLIVPSLTARVLLGDAGSNVAIVAGRIAGAALAAIAVICWRERGRGSRGLVTGLLVYDILVPVILSDAAAGYKLQGIGLWPAAGLHLVLALWGIVCLRFMAESVGQSAGEKH